MRKNKLDTFEKDFYEKFGNTPAAQGAAKWIKDYFTTKNVHTLAVSDAVLIVNIYRAVKKRYEETKDLNIANKVDLAKVGYDNRLLDGVIKQISICRYFGLVEQPPEWNNSGMWRLTELGRNVAKSISKVPKHCVVVNGEVVSKSKEEISLKEMFQTYNSKIERAIERKKQVNDRYYDFSKDYVASY